MNKLPDHPARFSDPLFPVMAQWLMGRERILDPMAGTGKVTYMAKHGVVGQFYLNEIEHGWANWCRLTGCVTTCGDARHLPYEDGFFDAVCTSPTYANRLADHCDWKDGSKRHTYKSYLGEALDFGNTGRLQWNDDYRQAHIEIWTECYRVLSPGGIFILNISDHKRRGKVMPVVAWHVWAMERIGFELINMEAVPTRRLRHGANAGDRLAQEMICVFTKKGV